MSERKRPERADQLGAADALLLTIQDVARLLQCSDRHIGNLRKEGHIPPPVKLGTAVRWPRRVIEDWIQAGCPETAERVPQAPQRPEDADESQAA
jgi:excisionase family DNA binding protein